MKVKGLVEYDIANYSKPSMFIIFPYCSFKCDIESGCDLCQNSALAHEPEVEISKEELCERYKSNPLTHAFVFGGLEPFDSIFDILPLVHCIRDKYGIKDDIVIYTGYTEDEMESGFRSNGDSAPSALMIDQWEELKKYPNIIVKFGRFKANEPSHFDPILGISLASQNQYARKISNENL